MSGFRTAASVRASSARQAGLGNHSDFATLLGARCLSSLRWLHRRPSDRCRRLWLACSDTLADWGDSALYAMLDDHGINEPENGVLVVGPHGLQGSEAVEESLVV